MDIVLYGALTSVVLLSICLYLYREVRRANLTNLSQQELLIENHRLIANLMVEVDQKVK